MGWYTTFIFFTMITFTHGVLISPELSFGPTPGFITDVSSKLCWHRAVDSLESFVMQFLNDVGIELTSIIIQSTVYTESTGITSVYLSQAIHGIPVINANINLDIDKDGCVISYGENAYKASIPDPPFLSEETMRRTLVFPPAQAFKALAPYLDFQIDEDSSHMKECNKMVTKHNPNGKLCTIEKAVNKNVQKDIDVGLSYVQNAVGSRLDLTYSLDVKLANKWYDAYVSTTTGKLVTANNWLTDGTYQSLTVNATDLSIDDRQFLSPPVCTNVPSDSWHVYGTNLYSDTRGNNVLAQQRPTVSNNMTTDYRPNGGETLTFNYPLDKSQQPETYIFASITQLYYLINAIHDILYVYGFNEVAGNFQFNNFNKGGLGGDPVLAYAQDPGGTNNANFATPPDGQSGVMNMYIWTYTSPRRDSTFEPGIVIHEYGHGLSNRLTGGPANSNCLSTAEAGGLGEGWSDVLATVFRQKSTNKRTDRFGMGTYVTGGSGIRNYPYTTDMSVNPSTFSYISKTGYSGVHAKGEVWAVILFEVYWNLVDALGFLPDLCSGSFSHGNTRFLHLIINGMKKQPCNPTFITARNAIIQADSLLPGPNSTCLIWKGFAKRGLGINARYQGRLAKDDYNTPAGCA